MFVPSIAKDSQSHASIDMILNPSHAMPFRWVQTHSQEFIKSHYAWLLVHVRSLGTAATQNIC
jgi:hypothetical protein